MIFPVLHNAHHFRQFAAQDEVLPDRRGLRVYRHALRRGVLLRPLGDVIYFMPPYVTTPQEIDLIFDVAHEGIELAVA